MGSWAFSNCTYTLIPKIFEMLQHLKTDISSVVLGEYDLATLIKTMSPKLSAEVYVFLSLHENDPVPRSLIDSSVFIFRNQAEVFSHQPMKN